MKRTRAILALGLVLSLGLFLLPQETQASASLVQVKAGTLTQSSPNAITFTSNVTVGNTLIAVGAHSYIGCPVSISDTQGNTWTKNGTQPDASGGGSGDFWYVFTAPVTTGGADTVTMTYGCGNMRTSYIAEYSGIASTPYDTENVNANTANDATTGSVTTAANGELILSMFYSTIANTFSAQGGATQEATNGQSALQDQTQTTAGAINPSNTVTTINASFPTYGFVATFKTVSSGPTPVVVAGPRLVLLKGSLVLRQGRLILGH